MVRSTWRLLRSRQRRLATLGACASGAAGLVFATIAALNGWAFGYDFFDEPAPTPAADTVAVACLWGMALAAVALAAVVYGAMVVVLAEDVNARAALRIAAKRAVPDAWAAIPAMALSIVLIATVFPCVVAAPIIGWATPRIVDRRAPRDHVGPSIPQHAAAAAVAGAFAALAWGATAVAAVVAGDGPARFPVLQAFLVVAAIGLVGSCAAAVVAATAVAVFEHATRPSPWPAPSALPWALAAAPSTAPLPGPAASPAPATPGPRWWHELQGSDRSVMLLTVAGVVLCTAFAVTYVCNVLVMGDPGPDATAADLARYAAQDRTVTHWWLGTTLPLLAVAAVLAVLSWRARRR